MNQELLLELSQYMSKYRREDSDFSSQFEENGMFTYGTTPFETFKKLIDSCQTPKRFVVLGSSIGWQCFFWNSLFPDITTIGYEIHDIRFDFCCYLGEKYNIKNVCFVNDDLTNIDIQDGDLIWLNNLCINDDVYDELIFKALSRYKDIQIISYTFVLQELQKNNKIIVMTSDNELKAYNQNSVNLPVSWCNNQTFYLINCNSPLSKINWFPEIGIDDIQPEFIIKSDHLSDFCSLKYTRKCIRSEKLKYLYNKKNIKDEFESIGFKVPKMYKYSTQEFDIENYTSQIEKCVIKPSHLSSSDSVVIKRGNKLSFVRSFDKTEKLNDLNRCLKITADKDEPEMLKSTEPGIIIEELIESVYEVKVFVVWGCPLIVDLRTGYLESHRMDFISKKNKYFNWDKEYDLIKDFAKRIRIDFFRIDFLYDGKNLYASECAFMPSTILPDEVEKLIADKWKSVYFKHYYPHLS